MYRILFVCYGNICRSPMAEMIFKDLVYTNNKRYLFSCLSRATSIEEIGNGMYPKAMAKLNEKGIKIEKHIAKQITKDDYNNFDYIIVFEKRNKDDVLRIIGNDPEDKIHLLLEYTDNVKDIDDPWYSDDFDTCFDEIQKGCLGLYNYLLERGKVDDNKI